MGPCRGAATIAGAPQGRPGTDGPGTDGPGTDGPGTDGADPHLRPQPVCRGQSEDGSGLLSLSGRATPSTARVPDPALVHSTSRPDSCSKRLPTSVPVANSGSAVNPPGIAGPPGPMAWPPHSTVRPS